MSKTRHNHPAPTPVRLCTSDCGRPIPDDAFLCTPCSETLWDTLLKVCQPPTDHNGQLGRSLVDELHLTIAGVDRIGGQEVGVIVRSAEIPLPWKEHASKTLHDLHWTLATWASTIAGRWGMTEELLATADAAANWLLRHHRRLCGTEISGQAYHQILTAVRSAEWAIDRPADRVFAGPCNTGDCMADLYGRVGAYTVNCQECGAEHNLDERREWLLQHLDDRLVHAGLLAGLLTMLDRQVTSSMIRNWAARGRLLSRWHDARGRPLYRVGDVIDIVAPETRRPTAC